MGPSTSLYNHPWIPEAYHEWTRDESTISCMSYYRFPEQPEHGFYVQTHASADGNGLYYVGPISFHHKSGLAERTGTAYACHNQDEVTETIEQMYTRPEMEKIHAIEELLQEPEEFEIAPF